jgi:hypothetical protein
MRDLQYAFRSVLRNPLGMVVMVSSLAVGLAVAMSIF